MQQYFAKNKALELEKEDYYHIKTVMRMKKGDIIKVVYDNVVNVCKLTTVNKEIKFDVVESYLTNQTNFNVTIAFSLIKEQKLNYLLQKATEVGASAFVPFSSKRSVVKIDEERKEKVKIERWQKICKEAAEQSGRTNVPVIMPIRSLKELMHLDYDVKLLCSLNKNTKNIKKILPKINKCDKMLLVVGPEGGFDSSEEEFLTQNGFQSISLGNNILRAETAPVVAISMINYEFMG